MDLIEHLKKEISHDTFTRGNSYFSRGKVNNRRKKGNRIYARVKGRRNYGVVIPIDGSSSPHCTCPFTDNNGVCKHIIAAALAFEKEPNTFIDMDEMRKKIYNQDQELLAELTAMIVEIYPDLIEDMGLNVRDGKDFDSDSILSSMLNELDPLDSTEVDIIVRRIKTIMGRAEIEFERGNYNVSRKILFNIIKNILELDKKHGSSEILPSGFLSFIFSNYLWVIENGKDINFSDIKMEIEKLKRFPHYGEEGLEKLEKKIPGMA